MSYITHMNFLLNANSCHDTHNIIFNLKNKIIWSTNYDITLITFNDVANLMNSCDVKSMNIAQ